jgi:YD repeat-containing protein
MSPDGSMLAAVGDLAPIRLWELDRCERWAELAVAPAGARCCAFSADGSQLLVGTTDGTLVRWDWNAQRRLAEIQVSNRGLTSLAVSPEGGLILAGDTAGIVHFLNAAGRITRPSVPAHDGPILDVRLFASSACFVTVGVMDMQIKVFETSTRALRFSLNTGPPGGLSVDISPNERILAAAGMDGHIRLWDLRDGRERISFGLSRHQLSVAFSERGAILLTGGCDGVVRFWNTASLFGPHAFDGLTAEPSDSDPVAAREASGPADLEFAANDRNAGH